MAWSAPLTAVTGVVFTATQFNTYVRDNLLVTAVGKATAPGRIFATNAANSVTERIPTQDVSYDYGWTNVTTYGDLNDGDGVPQLSVPSVTVVTGTRALAAWGGFMSNTIDGLGTYIACDVSGASTEAANDTNSVYAESAEPQDGHRMSFVTVYTTLTAGTNAFTLKYRTTAGGGISEYDGRVINIIPF